MKVKGVDVPVTLKASKDGGYEASIDLNGETKVHHIKDNFTLADSYIDAVIDGENKSVVQLVIIYVSIILFLFVYFNVNFVLNQESYLIAKRRIIKI